MDSTGEAPNHDPVIIRTGEYVITGRQRKANLETTADLPLIVAIHGGTFTAEYFDVVGQSFLDCASRLGFPVLAINRPGYGGSTPFAEGDATILHMAARLDEAIGLFWQQNRAGAPGIVLIGHSIGGAIAIAIAAGHPSWPLLGIAISGVGLIQPPGSAERVAGLPNLAMIQQPLDMKQHIMFGPAWTFAEQVMQQSGAANAPVPREELLDISQFWPHNIRRIAAQVAVPVHYRQGEFDRLWVVDNEQIADFAKALMAAPSVDADLFASAGHCIDLHRLGLAFQLEQLAFAQKCTVRAPA